MPLRSGRFSGHRRSASFRPAGSTGAHRKVGHLKLEVTADHSLEMKGQLFLLSPCEDYRSIRTVICGHSHSFAIAHGLILNPQHPVETPAMAAARRLALAGLRGTGMDAAYLAAMDRIAETKNVALIWDGNQPVRHFLLTAGRHLDLVPRDYPGARVLPGAQVVPEEAIRAHFAPSLVALDRFLARHKPRERTRRFLFGIHPPSGDDDEIRRRLVKEEYFTQRAAELGLDIQRIGITPASVRRKLWFVLERQMREIAERYDAPFIPAPAAAFDAAGFLKPELAGNDVSHAGFAYGRLMVEELARHLEG